MLSVLERYFALEEFLKNLNPQKKSEGNSVTFRSIGESFFPIPEMIFHMSDMEFQGWA